MPIDRNGGQYITANPQQPTQSSAPGIWDIDEQGSAQAAGRWPLPPNVVQRSLRFNSADSAYLNRTPAADGSRTTWTWSGWVKRSSVTDTQNILFGANGTSGVNSNSIRFSNGDASQKLVAENYNGVGADYYVISTAVYRDPSAWVS